MVRKVPCGPQVIRAMDLGLLRLANALSEVDESALWVVRMLRAVIRRFAGHWRTIVRVILSQGGSAVINMVLDRWIGPRG